MENKNDLQTLLDCLDYDPTTGVFTWKVNKSSKARKGQVAGGKPERNGYIRTRVNGQRYSLHRLAWFFFYGKLPEYQIDHINGVRTDNRICNLRDVTGAVNMQNAAMYITNKSGRIGVCFKYDRGKWLAQIKHNGIRYYLGYYEDFKDACAARDKAETELGFHKNHGRENKSKDVSTAALT